MPDPKEKATLGSTPKTQTNVESPPQAPTPRKPTIAPASSAASSSDTAGNQSSPVRDSQENAATRTPSYSYEEIERAAYLLYLDRGSVDGFADEDWLQAESELMAGRAAQQKARAKGA